MKDQNYGKVVTVPKEYVDRTAGDIVRHYSEMMARDLCDKVLTEMVKGECICSLSPMFQTEIPEEHLVEMRQKVTIRRLVRFTMRMSVARCATGCPSSRRRRSSHVKDMRQ